MKPSDYKEDKKSKEIVKKYKRVETKRCALCGYIKTGGDDCRNCDTEKQYKGG